MVGFLQWVDLTGVLFNAMIGAVIGRAAKLDVVGLVVLAIMSGLGRVSQRLGSMGGIVDSCLVLLCSMTLPGPGSSR